MYVTTGKSELQRWTDDDGGVALVVAVQPSRGVWAASA